MHVRYNPDGSKVAMSTESGTIYIFDTQKQALVSTFASHAMCVRMLSWSADGKVRFTSAFVWGYVLCYVVVIDLSPLAPSFRL